MPRLLTALALLALCAAFAGTARPAELITNRGATNVTLQVNAKGEALLAYKSAGKLHRVLIWGASDARHPTQNGHQVAFKKDFSGGWKTYHTKYWETFANRCSHYSGPALPNVVASCKAPDGSYWVAQTRQELLPDLGYLPWLPIQKASWLFVSHWSGPIAQIDTGMNWIEDGKWQQIFARVTYRGHPVYGFGTSKYGVPADAFGRIVYVDTHNSTYGNGWRRENASVTHNPTGLFCYGLSPHDPTTGGYRHPPGQTSPRGPGTGDKYRLAVNGPGVTPIVEKTIGGLHDWDAANPADVALQQDALARLESWGGYAEKGDCRKGWFDPA